MTRAASPPGTSVRRHALEYWSLCHAAPGQHAGPADVDADPRADWIAGAPGTVAAMLACAGRWNVDDPVLRLDAHDWWLRAQLQLDAAVPGTDSIGPLRLHGLGGLVDVWVNGQHALRSDNMFQAHVVDWRPLLRPGVNTVHLRVASLDAALQGAPCPPALAHADGGASATALVSPDAARPHTRLEPAGAAAWGPGATSNSTRRRPTRCRSRPCR
jgi:beta-galactosidase/beta-glucuronidase